MLRPETVEVPRELRQHDPNVWGSNMGANLDDTPDDTRVFVDGLKDAGAGLATALPESRLKSVYPPCAEDPDIRYVERLETKIVDGGALHY